MVFCGSGGTATGPLGAGAAAAAAGGVIGGTACAASGGVLAAAGVDDFLVAFLDALAGVALVLAWACTFFRQELRDELVFRVWQ
jgi:hypothetical protein